MQDKSTCTRTSFKNIGAYVRDITVEQVHVPSVPLPGSTLISLGSNEQNLLGSQYVVAVQAHSLQWHTRLSNDM